MRNLFFKILIFNLILTFVSFSYDWKSLSQNYENLLIKDPNNLDLLFDLFVIYMAEGRLDKAYDIYKKIEKLEPNLFYKKAKEIKEENIFSYYQLAFANYFSGNKEKALLYFNKIYNVNPQDDWVIAYLAYLHYEMGNIKSSESLVEEGIKINSNNEALHALKCAIYYRKGNYLLALKEYFITLSILQKKGYSELWQLLRGLAH